jgi:hypothetical protein
MSDQGAYDRNQRAAEREHDLVIDRGTRLTEASTRDTQEAIKLVLLINSGAAVAILAFISTLASRSGITLANLKSVTNSPIGSPKKVFSRVLRQDLHTYLTASMQVFHYR